MIRLSLFVLTIGFVLLSYSSSQYVSPQDYKNGVRKVAEKNKKDVNACAKQAEKKDKKIKGRLTIVWEIDEGGKAHNFNRGGDTTDNSELYHCLEKKMEKWMLSKPPMDRAIDVEHEFVF